MLHEPPTFLDRLLTRGERITMWLALGVGMGAWKADAWMQEGVSQNVALVFGAAYTIDVLMIVGFGFHMVATSIRVVPRLWPRRKR